MGLINTKTFKSGNSVAVRLPKELGIEADTLVSIERVGGTLRIKPVEAEGFPDDWAAMLTEIKVAWAEIGGSPPTQKREPIEFPERPGL